jgi:HlyD family secretion protein
MNADSDVLTIPNSHTSKSKIRILLVDDQKMMRETLRLWLESEPNLEIVGNVADGRTALEQVEREHPDIAIVDIEMPDMDGLTLAEIICQSFSETKVLILSSYDDVSYIKKALAVGAKGYLLKSTPPEELIHAIEFVHKGYLQLGPQLFEKLESEIASIEPREPQAPLTNPPETLSLQQDDRDWSDVTQENLDALPQVWTRGLLYLIILFTAVVLPWATSARIDVIGSARGRLEPKGKTVRLDAPIAGTVTAIAVREGEKVKAGQNLMELNSQVIRADLQQAQAKLEGLFERVINFQRLEHQLEANVVAQQQRDRAEASEQLETIAQIQQRINSNRTAIEAARQLLGKDRLVVERYRQFRQEGVISGNQLDEAERQAIENEQRLKQAESELEQNQTEVKKQQKAQEKILRQGELALIAAQKQLKELQAQIVDTRSEIAQTQNQIKSLQYQQQQSVLYAPIDGTIFELSVRHPGAVVQAGQAIATIAPKGVPLVLRAQMSSEQSGFLQVGMPVKIKFDAYPFQDYGIVPGHLSWISPDSRMAQQEPERSEAEQQTQEGVFELEITLDRDYIQAVNKRLTLTPGQTAKAEVVIRQRRAIDFFLDPFKKLQKTGLEL